MSAPQYLYRLVSVEKVTDGDTYWLRLDVGFRQWILVHARLYGWDTPELNSTSPHERAMAKDARSFVEVWFRAAAGLSVWVRTEKDPDSFGRWLATVSAWDEEGEMVSDLGDYLASHGLATRWPTRWREVHGT